MKKNLLTLLALGLTICSCAGSGDQQINVATEKLQGGFTKGPYTIEYDIEWPQSMNKGNVTTLQKSIFASFLTDTRTNFNTDIVGAINDVYGSYSGNYTEDDELIISFSAKQLCATEHFVTYYCYEQMDSHISMSGDTYYVNYDAVNDKVLSFSDVFKSPELVEFVLPNQDSNINDNTKFALLEEEVIVVVTEYARGIEEEKIPISKIEDALTPTGKALYNIKDVESVDDNSISKTVYESKDLQTFGLKGKVLKVVETEYRETDSNGNNSKYSFSETIDFTTGGTAKLEGTVVRDENGYLSSFESGDGGDGWQLKEWTYSSKGDVLVYKVDTYGGSRDYHYVYDDEGNITMALSQGMYEEGEEYEIKTNYTILEKDAKGNWTNMLVKIVETIEGEIQKPEYQRITRQITYQ